MSLGLRLAHALGEAVPEALVEAGANAGNSWNRIVPEAWTVLLDLLSLPLTLPWSQPLPQRVPPFPQPLHQSVEHRQRAALFCLEGFFKAVNPLEEGGHVGLGLESCLCLCLLIRRP